MSAPRIFSVPAGAPFLSTLADGVLSGELVGQAGLALADTTIYLPTRRACRALSGLLAARAGGTILLPHITPLGELDQPDDSRWPAPPGPVAVAPLERRLILARLIQEWARRLDAADRAPDAPILVPATAADAIALAADLEGLMDSLAIEGIDWSALEEAVEIDYSQYFALTLKFVRIAHEAWPAILAARGAADPARLRQAAILAEAARIAAGQAGPVIAAGSTGSVTATATLLAAIAQAPRSAVVLPGLDQDLDAAAWEAIGEGDEDGPAWGHPQFMLRRLLVEHLRATRGDVRMLATPSERTSDRAQRRRMISQVMRPAATTDDWAAIPPFDRDAMVGAGTDGLAIVEAADEREEALAIAVAIRETLEAPGRTAALVTPDRMLARRVVAELGRWGIEAEDSAGLSLAEAAAGRLARLAAEAAALGFPPLAVLSLLTHAEVRLGLRPNELERGRAALEIAVLRGPAPAAGLDGLAAAVKLRRDGRSRRDPLPRQLLSERDWRLAARLVERLQRAFAGFANSEGESSQDLVALAGRHAEAVAALVQRARGEAEPEDPCWTALTTLFDDLALAASGLAGRFRDYPAFFAGLARERALPPDRVGGHPRVAILGLLEARLLEADRIVLGGLDEGIWPPAATSDAFLNRPMRLKLGLSPPERRIGQTAHDFVQAIATPDAVVTRARKRDGNPTVPSRFLERLQAFVGEPAWSRMRAKGERYRTLALMLDAPRRVSPSRAPAPKPGADRFPRHLSVTEIETLVRDPYAIYARHILRLSPLDAIGTAPSAAERGSILHDVLAKFSGAQAGLLPGHAAERLIQLGLNAFRPIADAYPDVHALWWAEFERLVPAFIAWEAGRRQGLTDLHLETRGSLAIPLGSGDQLVVSGRADRIELGPDRAAIVDFKTGSPPTHRQIAVGFSPQLTLEAAMLGAGGFGDIAAASATPDLVHVKLGGRAVLKEDAFAPPRGDTRSVAEIVAEHAAGLATLARRYGVEGAGYRSRPYVKYALRFSAYDHLARVKEWAAAGEDESEASA